MLETISTGLLVVFLVLPILSAIRLIVKRKATVKSWGGGLLLSAVGCYLLMLASVKLTDAHLEARLNEYDLNGDGSFSGAEVTPQMEEAMAEWASDTGRSLAPITGLFMSPLYSGFWHLALGLPYLLFRWVNRAKGEPCEPAPEKPSA